MDYNVLQSIRVPQIEHLLLNDSNNKLERNNGRNGKSLCNFVVQVHIRFGKASQPLLSNKKVNNNNKNSCVGLK